MQPTPTPAPTPAPSSRTRVPVLAVVATVVLGTVVGLLGDRPVPPVPSGRHVTLVPEGRTATGHPVARHGAPPLEGPGSDTGRVAAADGGVPDGATPFDDDLPAVARLDADLRAVLRSAATDARLDGVTVLVTSGWRSADYQDLLLREAVERYGSAAEAARWVATAETSPHVQGLAVDVGDDAAIAWLATHGAAYGLCPVYANEPWHHELRPQAVTDGCPALYPDPTADPRMRR
ncbi:M15 family metallopeptidase [Cellulomonas fimi]|uniref:Peptidase M15B and M15C DD-carboxypeptidase VanY/endolysin n=1 Tax=Cellulomonas fimi (strain ATCC 484 / DSM 20113 / JCM 1341 / CCUG 24087 / LMG 16345 / NBRC 15513 / NCIMB 8980 / NCTC 7547 / NRS-133) TaxID=590998 RepID=F4GZ31_CELFA|nr:M15 family metallopeptidase [Cellulomonas fimi]AEE46021.1 peptidase M15B and M15C DD-carboxypeptidase VanY/endolysin [Cellulomonas fimi ATCC 484]NNH08921.1 M15 family metallopeptidase [Cellulomonas fimi]VEH31324.1 D-alanyl-D-alanine carboxypeptidase [Cellulomonas fimi]